MKALVIFALLTVGGCGGGEAPTTQTPGDGGSGAGAGSGTGGNSSGGGGAGGSIGSPAAQSTTFTIELRQIELRRLSNGASLPVDTSGVTSGTLTLYD